MKHIWLSLSLVGGFLLGHAPTALADNVAHCEVLLVDILEDEETKNQTQVASYRPAVNFIASVYDDAPEHLTEIDGHAIRALLCRRNNVIPSETDYPMIATGVPFIASQDFDSPDTDSLTVYWKEDAFDYVYKGHPLSEESQELLDARLADFTARGLKKTETDADAETSEGEADETAHKNEAVTDEAETESLDLDLESSEIEIGGNLGALVTDSDIELDNITANETPADMPEGKSEE